MFAINSIERMRKQRIKTDIKMLRKWAEEVELTKFKKCYNKLGGYSLFFLSFFKFKVDMYTCV